MLKRLVPLVALAPQDAYRNIYAPSLVSLARSQTSTGASSTRREQRLLLSRKLSSRLRSTRFNEQTRRLFEQANCLVWQADVFEVFADRPHDRAFDPQRGTYLDWYLQVIQQDETEVPDWLPLYRERGDTITEAFFRSRNPEDMADLDHHSHDALRSGKLRYTHTFRTRMIDGSVRWLCEDARIVPLPSSHDPQGHASPNRDGVPLRRWHLTGVVTDVTEQKQAEEALEAARASLRQVMDRANCLLWLAQVSEIFPEEGEHMPFDTVRGTQLTWNLNVINLAGMEMPSWLPLYREAGMTITGAFRDARNPDDVLILDRNAQEALRTGKPRYTQTFRARMADGSVRWLSEDVRIEALPHWLDPQGQGVPYAGPNTDGLPLHRWQLTGVVTDITEQKQAEEALRTLHEELEVRVAQRTRELTVAIEEAERANVAKSEFLSRMSHELRTPLNAILGFGQLLERQKLSEMQKESVHYILRGGRHLLSLINEILDIARVEAGHVELSIEAISLADVIPEACSLVRPLAMERNVRLQEDCEPLENLYVQADRQRFQQVLINLLSNGIKYNRPGGKVTVRCQERPEGRVQVAIQDTGRGIAAEDLPKLFSPFERLSAANSDIEGTGLGLVLSQRLLTAMNGTLSVQSVLGEGSTFIIELPQGIDPVRRVPDFAQRTARSTLATNADERFTVLCIEDNLSNLRLMEAILEDHPEIELLAAMQGRVGVDLARQHRPDLVLLDLNLPDLSGKEVLSVLKQETRTKAIPVAIISADATAGQIERLESAGADAYLTKPLDVPLFLEVIESFLHRKAPARCS